MLFTVVDVDLRDASLPCTVEDLVVLRFSVPAGLASLLFWTDDDVLRVSLVWLADWLPADLLPVAAVLLLSVPPVAA